MTFAGLPFHFIVLHAAVVFGPLTAMVAVVFAFRPQWRYLTRWPTAVLTLITFVSVWLSRLSGQSYLSSRPDLAQLVHEHQQRGQLLSLLTTLFAVVVAVAVWGLGGPSGFAGGGGARAARSTSLERGLAVAVAVTALLMLVWVVLTGDAGARAAWG
jgi:phosphoglycerol transferase MdoB-like AlkP superfamily enzyme